MTGAIADCTAISQRVLSLRSNSSHYISNPDFNRAGEGLSDPFVDQVLASRVPTTETPTGLPAHLQRMCDSELLTFEQEQTLFKAMNYRKFLASEFLSELDAATASWQSVEEIESLQQEALSLRDHLIKSNMRLVISIVKKFVCTQSTFDEMLSDGLVSLMNCVDKFDFDRGFRFSTYAYRSIARDLYRTVKSAKLRSTQVSQAGEEWSIEPADERGSSAVQDGFWSTLRETAGAMIGQLDRRERFIIRCRYALGSHRKVKSLQFLANKLGVSKERVRQLEIRAVGKLRNMAADIELDDVAGSGVL